MPIVNQYGAAQQFDSTGRLLPPGTRINVFVNGGALATLYADLTGGSTASNPVTIDENSNLTFIAEAGQLYQIQAIIGTAVTPKVVVLVPVTAASGVDSTAVHKTGNEIVDGVKSFNEPPVFPAGSISQSTITGLVSLLSSLTGPPAWTTPTTTNGWVNAGAGQNAIAYCLVGRFVYFRGVANGTTLGTSMFLLPPGYRPVAITPLATTASGGHSVIFVGPFGDVTPSVGSTSGVSLEGLFFSVS